MHSGQFSLRTNQHMELVDITDQVQAAIRASGRANGICFVTSPHTTAGITINEGADPDVQLDIIGALRSMLPTGYPYRHREGNSPSHVLTTLTGSTSTVFFSDGRLQLGTWQRIFFCEFDGPRTRKVWCNILTD